MRRKQRTGLIEPATSARRRSFFLLALFIPVGSLVLSGCFRRSPYKIAERYIENLQQFDYLKCYKLLSVQDRADRTLHQFLTEIPLAPDVSPIWFRPILHVMRFELGDEHRSSGGSTAYVTVRITAPDLPRWERTLDANAGGDGSPSQLVDRSLATGAYPTVTYEDKIFLVKEYQAWHVMAGLAARDRFLERYRQAMRDFYEGRMDQTIAQFNSLIAELEHLPGTGNLGLAAHLRADVTNMSKLKAEAPAVTAYIAKLKLGQVAMRMALERVPAIFGEVTNAGDRPIDELRLAVTWYQGRGKNLKIVQREEHPIVVTPIEFTDFTRRVIPFLSGEKRQFGFVLAASPAVQQNATPYVSIASLAFTEIPAPIPTLQAVSSSKAHSSDNRVSATHSLAPASPVPASNSSLAAAHPGKITQRAAVH